LVAGAFDHRPRKFFQTRYHGKGNRNPALHPILGKQQGVFVAAAFDARLAARLVLCRFARFSDDPGSLCQSRNIENQNNPTVSHDGCARSGKSMAAHAGR